MTNPPEHETDTDIRVGLARMTEKVAGLEKTTGREFSHIGNSLDKIGAFIIELKNEFVSKADHNAVVDRLSRVKKILYTTLGVVLLAVLAAVLANVGLKK